MIAYPATVEEKIGFTTVKSRLRHYLLSPMGEESLAAQQPSSDIGWIREEMERVSALQEMLRFDDPVPLYRVGDIRDGLRLIMPAGSQAEPAMLLSTLQVLETFRRLKLHFNSRRDRFPAIWAIVQDLVAMPDLEKRIAETVDPDGRIKDTASGELRRIRRSLVNTQNRLREALNRELHRSMGQGYTTEAQPTIRSGRMVIPVRAEAKRKIDGFVHDVSASGQTVYIEPAKCLDLNNEVRALEAEEFHEIRRILIALADALREHAHTLLNACDSFGVLDTIQAKAHVSNELNAHAVTLNERGFVHIVAGRNPALQLHFNAQNKTSTTDQEADKATSDQRLVVPLDIELGGAFNTLILTGPNAGGKTVAMKTIGLFALMVAHGMPLPADERSEFGVFSKLIVDIGDEQSIENDLSTFSSHVANLRYMMEHTDDRTLVLIDEAGTGTDPSEGAALAQVILEDLTNLGARTIATTHHGALKVFAHERNEVENGSMEFDRDTLRPTYRLRLGIPGSSYAFEIASRMGLDQGIINRSRGLLGEQTVRMEDLIAALDARNQALTARLEQVEHSLAQAQQQRERYERLFDQLEAQKEDIKEKALEEAESVMQRANAEIERTIREIKEHQAAREQTKQVRSQLETFRSEIKEEKKRTSSKKQKRSKRKQGTKKRDSRPAPREGLQVGDQVVLDGGSATAELLELDGKNAVIMSGSIHMRVKVDRLTKVAGPRKQQVTVRQIAKGNDKGVAALKATQRIDVRGKRVDEAISIVVRFVDEAVAANLNRVEIVHGKGTGALRGAIHEFMQRTPDIARFEEAPVNEGGPGVTYAFLA